MSAAEEPQIRVRVDSMNPGQFFACCGLLELADRLWGGAEGWFETGVFLMNARARDPSGAQGLQGLLGSFARASLEAADPDDEPASPIRISEPIAMTLDWWKDERAGGKSLKVWAGRMSGVRIARAMQHVLGRPELWTESLFDYSAVVFDPAEPAKKVEPYHFDSRRGALARPIDAGFSLDPLDLVSVTFPAVEILCLVGLQRFRPRCMPQARFFEYFTWGIPLGADVAPAAVCGWLPGTQPRGFHFENGFRTDQRKHKAFMPATRLEGSSL